MTNSRNQILHNIRQAVKRTGEIDESKINVATEFAKLTSAKQAHVQPHLHKELLPAFIQEAQTSAAQVHSLSEETAISAWLVQRAKQLNQQPQLTFAPEFSNLKVDPPIKTSEHILAANSWGLCRGIIGIAETGTVISNSHNCASGLLFLVERLIVVVNQSDIVAYQEDAWKILRHRFNEQLPRSINLITGPSRTADVEQTLQIGAHGPKWVDYLIVG